MTLSMAIDALLMSETDSITLLCVRDRFSGLPTPTAELATLYTALLGICDMAVLFDENRVQTIYTSLLSLSASFNVQLN